MALEYLRHLEDGAEPRLAEFESRLDNEAARGELRALVEAARWARARFPAPFRSEVLVGDRYRLIRQIGAGGYGKVWLAEDTRLSRDVALKIVTAFGDAEAAAKAIRTEVGTLARLSHRGIVRLYDSGSHDGSCYVAMEHIDGVSLAELLERLPPGPPDAVALRQALDGRLPPGESSRLADDWLQFAAGTAVEMLWALAAAHGNGVVHRDLKPANVMLTQSGRVVLLDFGLAGLRDRDSGTITQGLFGTTPYLAPEQLAASRSGKSTAIDVYQTGLVLYELLARQRAFTASPHERLVRQILEGDCPRPRRLQPGLPAALEDIVLRAIDRDPAHRYASADAFRQDLERWLEGAEPAAAAGGAAMRVVRDARRAAFRRRRPLALAAALLLGALPVWILQPPAQLVQDLEYVADQGVAFRLDRVAMVMPLGVWTDANRKVVGYQPAVVVVEKESPAPHLQLPAGRHHLRVEVPRPEPSVPGARLHVVVRATDDATEAAAWRQFMPLVAAATQRRARALLPEEMAKLHAEALAPDRGVPLPPFAIDRLLGDGTLPDAVR